MYWTCDQFFFLFLFPFLLAGIELEDVVSCKLLASKFCGDTAVALLSSISPSKRLRFKHAASCCSSVWSIRSPGSRPLISYAGSIS